MTEAPPPTPPWKPPRQPSPNRLTSSRPVKQKYLARDNKDKIESVEGVRGEIGTIASGLADGLAQQTPQVERRADTDVLMPDADATAETPLRGLRQAQGLAASRWASPPPENRVQLVGDVDTAVAHAVRGLSERFVHQQAPQPHLQEPPQVDIPMPDAESIAEASPPCRKMNGGIAASRFATPEGASTAPRRRGRDAAAITTSLWRPFFGQLISEPRVLQPRLELDTGMSDVDIAGEQWSQESTQSESEDQGKGKEKEENTGRNRSFNANRFLVGGWKPYKLGNQQDRQDDTVMPDVDATPEGPSHTNEHPPSNTSTANSRSRGKATSSLSHTNFTAFVNAKANGLGDAQTGQEAQSSNLSVDGEDSLGTESRRSQRGGLQNNTAKSYVEATKTEAPSMRKRKSITLKRGKLYAPTMPEAEPTIARPSLANAPPPFKSSGSQSDSKGKAAAPTYTRFNDITNAKAAALGDDEAAEQARQLLQRLAEGELLEPEWRRMWAKQIRDSHRQPANLPPRIPIDCGRRFGIPTERRAGAADMVLRYSRHVSMITEFMIDAFMIDAGCEISSSQKGVFGISALMRDLERPAVPGPYLDHPPPTHETNVRDFAHETRRTRTPVAVEVESDDSWYFRDAGRVRGRNGEMYWGDNRGSGGARRAAVAEQQRIQIEELMRPPEMSGKRRASPDTEEHAALGGASVFEGVMRGIRSGARFGESIRPTAKEVVDEGWTLIVNERPTQPQNDIGDVATEEEENNINEVEWTMHEGMELGRPQETTEVGTAGEDDIYNSKPPHSPGLPVSNGRDDSSLSGLSSSREGLSQGGSSFLHGDGVQDLFESEDAPDDNAGCAAPEMMTRSGEQETFTMEQRSLFYAKVGGHDASNARAAERYYDAQASGNASYAPSTLPALTEDSGKTSSGSSSLQMRERSRLQGYVPKRASSPKAEAAPVESPQSSAIRPQRTSSAWNPEAARIKAHGFLAAEAPLPGLRPFLERMGYLPAEASFARSQPPWWQNANHTSSAIATTVLTRRPPSIPESATTASLDVAAQSFNFSNLDTPERGFEHVKENRGFIQHSIDNDSTRETNEAEIPSPTVSALRERQEVKTEISELKEIGVQFSAAGTAAREAGSAEGTSDGNGEARSGGSGKTTPAASELGDVIVGTPNNGSNAEILSELATGEDGEQGLELAANELVEQSVPLEAARRENSLGRSYVLPDENEHLCSTQQPASILALEKESQHIRRSVTDEERRQFTTFEDQLYSIYLRSWLLQRLTLVLQKLQEQRPHADLWATVHHITHDDIPRYVEYHVEMAQDAWAVWLPRQTGAIASAPASTSTPVSAAAWQCPTPNTAPTSSAPKPAPSAQGYAILQQSTDIRILLGVHNDDNRLAKYDELFPPLWNVSEGSRPPSEYRACVPVGGQTGMASHPFSPATAPNSPARHGRSVGRCSAQNNRATYQLFGTGLCTRLTWHQSSGDAARTANGRVSRTPPGLGFCEGKLGQNTGPLEAMGQAIEPQLGQTPAPSRYDLEHMRRQNAPLGMHGTPASARARHVSLHSQPWSSIPGSLPVVMRARSDLAGKRNVASSPAEIFAASEQCAAAAPILSSEQPRTSLTPLAHASRISDAKEVPAVAAGKDRTGRCTAAARQLHRGRERARRHHRHLSREARASIAEQTSAVTVPSSSEMPKTGNAADEMKLRGGATQWPDKKRKGRSAGRGDSENSPAPFPPPRARLLISQSLNQDSKEYNQDIESVTSSLQGYRQAHLSEYVEESRRRTTEVLVTRNPAPEQLESTSAARYPTALDPPPDAGTGNRWEGRVNAEEGGHKLSARMLLAWGELPRLEPSPFVERPGRNGQREAAWIGPWVGSLAGSLSASRSMSIAKPDNPVIVMLEDLVHTDRDVRMLARIVGDGKMFMHDLEEWQAHIERSMSALKQKEMEASAAQQATWDDSCKDCRFKGGARPKSTKPKGIERAPLPARPIVPAPTPPTYESFKPASTNTTHLMAHTIAPAPSTPTPRTWAGYARSVCAGGPGNALTIYQAPISAIIVPRAITCYENMWMRIGYDMLSTLPPGIGYDHGGPRPPIAMLPLMGQTSAVMAHHLPTTTTFIRLATPGLFSLPLVERPEGYVPPGLAGVGAWARLMTDEVEDFQQRAAQSPSQSPERSSLHEAILTTLTTNAMQLLEMVESKRVTKRQKSEVSHDEEGFIEEAPDSESKGDEPPRGRARRRAGSSDSEWSPLRGGALNSGAHEAPTQEPPSSAGIPSSGQGSQEADSASLPIARQFAGTHISLGDYSASLPAQASSSAPHLPIARQFTSFLGQVASGQSRIPVPTFMNRIPFSDPPSSRPIRPTAGLDGVTDDTENSLFEDNEFEEGELEELGPGDFNIGFELPPLNALGNPRIPPGATPSEIMETVREEWDRLFEAQEAVLEERMQNTEHSSVTSPTSSAIEEALREDRMQGLEYEYFNRPQVRVGLEGGRGLRSAPVTPPLAEVVSTGWSYDNRSLASLSDGGGETPIGYFSADEGSAVLYVSAQQPIRNPLQPPTAPFTTVVGGMYRLRQGDSVPLQGHEEEGRNLRRFQEARRQNYHAGRPFIIFEEFLRREQQPPDDTRILADDVWEGHQALQRVTNEMPGFLSSFRHAFLSARIGGVDYDRSAYAESLLRSTATSGHSAGERGGAPQGVWYTTTFRRRLDANKKRKCGHAPKPDDDSGLESDDDEEYISFEWEVPIPAGTMKDLLRSTDSSWGVKATRARNWAFEEMARESKSDACCDALGEWWEAVREVTSSAGDERCRGVDVRVLEP